MKVFGVKCLICGDTIISRARHDFHYCFCENVFIDGGQSDSIWRRGGISMDDTEVIEMTLDGVDKHDLYDDWNNATDKYARFKDDSYTDEVRSIAKAKVLLLNK